MTNFDEELTGSHENGLFGIPTTLENSELCLFPVPWEVTTSYGRGTSKGPQTILEASPQIDLFDPNFGDTWKKGFHWDAQFEDLKSKNGELSQLARSYIESVENGEETAKMVSDLDKINYGCGEMVETVYQAAKQRLKEGKLVGLVGGDHSTPEGLIKALCEKYSGGFGILHLDAHHDLRKAYQGFQHSHASIMYNVMNLDPAPVQLTQVGIRDYSRSENAMADSDSRIQTFYDKDVKARLFSGLNWAELCKEIVGTLPDHVYISFDIDGLSPEFCPSTGTPVPGGLSYDQATYLLYTLGVSGKKIIGFDLNEVSPSESGDDWDANVGSRILFQLCSWSIKS